MEITFDASEIAAFAQAMAEAPDVFQSEMTDASAVALHEGIGYAMENAPVSPGGGDLKNSIRIIEPATAEGGSYGSSLEYAWMREEGGTIYPRNGKFLVFEIEGRKVFARKVTQTGTKYMERSAETLEGRLVGIYSLAADRTLGRI